MFGVTDVFLCENTGNQNMSVSFELLFYFGRVIGTCAVFYVFFLYRMLGAGDIKLMAVCVGILGVRDGGLMIFYGLLSALAVFCIRRKVWKHGLLMMRGSKIRLAPYLLAGYAVLMLGGYS